jgi:tetratricopeptide (TPR) repeat protein
MTQGLLTEAEAQYYLGDLLLQEKRVEEAEMRFRHSLTLDPALAPSCVSMGLVRLQQDNLEEAFKYFARAVEADSDNYLAHYYYAYLLQIVKHESDENDERSRFASMRDHLKRAIALAPDYLNAYELLADVALASSEDGSATQELLERALSAPRGTIRLSVAELMIRNRETAAAQVLLKPMADAGEDDPLHERAQALLSEMQDVIAQKPEAARDK